MADILLRSNLVSRGLSDTDVARLRSAGGLQQVRRGAYVRPVEVPDTTEKKHRLLIDATLPQLERAAVLSHGSAAVLHGLPVWPDAVAQVHLTRPRSGGGQRRRIVHRHATPLDGSEVTEVEGIPVTTRGRTVVDLARTVPLERGVTAADRALALGLDRSELDEAVRRSARWPGAAVGRRVAALADPRSESVGESLSRVLLADWGVPSPELQLEVFDRSHLVGRVDFAWPELGVLGEFDGRVKYGRLLRAVDDVGEVVYREKLREDALRDLGWQVVRWTWPELAHPEIIVERLDRAFRRARR
ncbi:MAG: hypothetical protein ACRYG2_17770 [Janthinobacterium lividum]